MRPIGSVLLALWLALSTPPFALVAIITTPLPARTRYTIISQWSRLAIGAARLCCGIRYRVVGLKNLPPQPCVLLSRHESAWETIAYQAIFPPQAMVLKKELLRIPFFGWGLARMSPIAIDRNSGRRALRQMEEQGKKRLAAGFYVIIFPEGTRMAPGAQREYQPGGAWLAKKNNVPAVPISVNSGYCWPKDAFFKRAGLITVRIGSAFATADLSVNNINRQVKNWIESQTDNNNED